MKQKREIVGVFYMNVLQRIGRTVTLDDVVDMLRYDCAFIKPELPEIVAFPTWKTRGQGTYRGTCTTDRWRSFGLGIVEVKGPTLAEFLNEADRWTTYRTTDHVKTTLREFMEGEN